MIVVFLQARFEHHDKVMDLLEFIEKNYTKDEFCFILSPTSEKTFSTEEISELMSIIANKLEQQG